MYKYIFFVYFSSNLSSTEEIIPIEKEFNVDISIYKDFFHENMKEKIIENFKILNVNDPIKNNNKKYFGISFYLISKNLKKIFVDLKNFTNMDINIIKKFFQYIFHKFFLIAFLKSFLHFFVWLLFVILIIGGLFWGSLKKIFYPKDILDSKLWGNVLINSFYKVFFFKGKNEHIKSQLSKIDNLFLEKEYSSQKSAINNLQKKADKFFELIKNNQKNITNNFIENSCELVKEALFHLEKINNNFNELEKETSQNKKIQKVYTLNILRSIYHLLDVGKTLLTDKELNKNINLIEILDKAIEIISFLLPTEHELLKLLLKENVLKSLQESIKKLIERKENEESFSFYEVKQDEAINTNNKKLIYELVEVDKYKNQLSIFDEEFYEDIIKEVIVHVINKDFFLWPLSSFINQIKTYLLFPDMIESIKNIIYMNVNFFDETDILTKKEKNKALLANQKFNKNNIRATIQDKNNEKNERIKKFLLEKLLIYAPKKTNKKKHINIKQVKIDKFNYEEDEEYKKNNFFKLKDEIDFAEYINFFFDFIETIPEKYDDIIFLIYFIYMNYTNDNSDYSSGYKLLTILKNECKYSDILIFKDFLINLDIKEILTVIESSTDKFIKPFQLIDVSFFKDLNTLFNKLNSENYCRFLFNYMSFDNPNISSMEKEKSFTEYLKFFKSMLNYKEVDTIKEFFIKKVKNNESMDNLISINEKDNVTSFIKIILFSIYSLSLKKKNLSIYDINKMFERINNQHHTNYNEKSFLDINSDGDIIRKIIKVFFKTLEKNNEEISDYLDSIIFNIYKIVETDVIGNNINKILESFEKIVKLINKNTEKSSILYEKKIRKNDQILLSIHTDTIIRIIFLLLEEFLNENMTDNIPILKNILINSRKNLGDLAEKILTEENIKKLMEILKKFKENKKIIKIFNEIFNLGLKDFRTNNIPLEFNRIFFNNLSKILKDKELINLIVDLLKSSGINEKIIEIIVNKLSIGNIPLVSMELKVLNELFDKIYPILITFIINQIHEINFDNEINNDFKKILNKMLENFGNSKESKKIIQLLIEYLNTHFIYRKLDEQTNINSLLEIFPQIIIPNLTFIINNYSIKDLLDIDVYINHINEGKK